MQSHTLPFCTHAHTQHATQKNTQPLPPSHLRPRLVGQPHAEPQKDAADDQHADVHGGALSFLVFFVRAKEKMYVKVVCGWMQWGRQGHVCVHKQRPPHAPHTNTTTHNTNNNHHHTPLSLHLQHRAGDEPEAAKDAREAAAVARRRERPDRRAARRGQVQGRDEEREQVVVKLAVRGLFVCCVCVRAGMRVGRREGKGDSYFVRPAHGHHERLHQHHHPSSSSIHASRITRNAHTLELVTSAPAAAWMSGKNARWKPSIDATPPATPLS